MCKTPFRNNVLHKTKKPLSFLNGLAEEERFELSLIRRGELRRFSPDYIGIGFSHFKNKKVFAEKCKDFNFAEEERFELSLRIYSLRRFSKPLVSATHPPFRIK